MRVLITGANGQVGRELVRQAPSAATLRALTHDEFDISDAGAVGKEIGGFRPTLILNAAAYTAVDRAESEPELARRINATGPLLLADAARALGSCRVIQLSTDYVFDGKSSTAYGPDDEPHPLNIYGHTKRDGEVAVLATLKSQAIVIRTSWVYSGRGNNFLLTMLRRMRSGAELRVVTDQIGTPTSAPSVAEAVWAIAQRGELSGIYHWTDRGVASWHDFAVAISEQAAANGMLPLGIKVHAISTGEYPAAAQRPLRSVLDCRRTIAELGLDPLHWRLRLRQVLNGSCDV